MKRLITIFSSALIAATSLAQDLNFCNPLDPVTTLSGSYLELRRNHFHGGLDFRTGGEVGKKIFAVEDGYISRVSVEARSYGKKIVITHRDGTQSLYAHLNGFLGDLASRVRQEQEKNETFEVDLYFEADEFPVTKGEQIAWSGNTGSSGGPHLHFELKTPDGVLINPFKYNDVWQLQDNRKPLISSIKVVSEEGEGTLLGRTSVKYNTRAVGSEKRINGPQSIKAWGKVNIEVKAFDFMTGTAFHHTPREIKLLVDSQVVSRVRIEDVNFKDTRALNSFIDYAQQQRTGEYFMKFTKDKNCPLNIYRQLIEDGSVVINQEKTYDIAIEVTDDKGSKDILRFSIIGENMDIKPKAAAIGGIIRSGEATLINENDFLMYIPENALYTDIERNYYAKESTKYFSKVYHIGAPTPVHTFCDLTIKIDRDSLADKSQYVIAQLNEQGIVMKAYSGKYENGYISAKVRDMGYYAVWKDDHAPVVGPMQTKNLRQNNRIVMHLSDGLTGIAGYSGDIDGQWVLFEYDAKTATAFCFLPAEKVEKNNTMHKFTFKAWDWCGNVATYTKSILY